MISLFSTEILLVSIALLCLILDIFIKNEQSRSNTLSMFAMTGIALTFATTALGWGNFGQAFGGSFVQDGLSLFFKLLFLTAGFIVLFLAREYQSKLKRGHAEFTLLILFSLIGMSFLTSAADFLVFFVALETLTISMYIMTAYLRDQQGSIEAGVKYLVLGAISTAVFLYGLSFVYGATGSTSYAVIQERISQMVYIPRSYTFGMTLVIASLLFKIASVPFHIWAPDVYEGAPTPITAYLSIGSKAAGFAALIRLLSSAFAPALTDLSFLFAVCAALTIIYGNIGAIGQTNIKRLLGYSSIGHSGYMLIGLAAFAHSGKEAILYYLVSYLVSTAGIFLVLISLTKELKSDEISELAGLSKRSPHLAAVMMLSLLSLAGIPPLAGFFAKFYLLFSGVKAGYLWLVFIGVLNVITSLYYYLKIVKVMYVDKPATYVEFTPTLGHKIMQYASIGGIFFLGIFQGPLVGFIQAVFAK